MYYCVLFFSLLLSGVLFLVSIVGISSWAAASNSNSLEAGFFSTGNTHLSVSLQFLLLLLIFIMFDTELLFTFGLVSTTATSAILNIGILAFLFLTLLYEWNLSKLRWLS